MTREVLAGKLVAVASGTLTGSGTAAAEAWSRAGAAAAAGGLTVRELTEPSEHRAAEALLAAIWSVSPEQAPVSGDVMRSLAYTGGYVAGAFSGAELIGAAVGFLATGAGAAPRLQLHSHVAGVIPSAQGRSVGSALKLHQRAWALARGLDAITWTFDPLVRRNAFFNLTKLGADATAYLADFYGEMHDGINAGQGSDRLVVRWDLGSERAVAAAAGRPAEPEVAGLISGDDVLLGIGPGGGPEPAPAGSGGRRVACAVPGDVEALRRTRPELALAWRSALRQALSPALADGMRIAGFARSGWYLLSYPGRGGEAARDETAGGGVGAPPSGGGRGWGPVRGGEAARGTADRTLVTTVVELGLDDLVVGAVAAGADPRLALTRVANEAASRAEAARGLDPPTLAAVVGMESAGQLTATQAKAVLGHLIDHGGDPAEVVRSLGYEALSAGTLSAAVDEVVAAHPSEWERWCAGEDKVAGFFVGQVMKA
ncbi:MAG: hypothetical protein ACRD0J_18080, partial [Acidimicrobiales bacterium]